MNFQSHEAFLSKIQDYCSENLVHLVAEIDRTDTIPEEVYRNLAELRLFALEKLHDDGPFLPEKERILVVLRALSIISEVSPSVAKAVMDQNLGQIGMMRQYGGPSIQDKLEQIRTGKKQAAFLMTEPQSGSDISAFSTRFRRTSDGVVINGTKDWITGASRRQYFITLAREEDSERTFGLFLVEKELMPPGSISITDRKNKLGLRGLGEYRVELRDVHVPKENFILDGAGTIGKIMRHYNIKRCGQATMANGCALAAIRTAHAYLEGRFSDRGGITFQNTLFTLSDLYSRVIAVESLPFTSALSAISNDNTGLSAAIAKYVCTELAVEVTGKVTKLCGGNGLSDKLPLERKMRDMRMLTVAGGASEVLQDTISKSLGVVLNLKSPLSEHSRSMFSISSQG